MSRLWSNLTTMVGCVIALVSFCFLPYLEVPSTPFAFTGWQLVNSGSEISLPGYFVYSGVQAVLRNVPLLWAPLLLVLLLLLAAGGNSVLPQRDELAAPRRGCVVVALASLAFTCLLCIWARGAASAFDFMSAHGNTLRGLISGDPASGLWGFVLGIVVALIGSLITLLGKRSE